MKRDCTMWIGHYQGYGKRTYTLDEDRFFVFGLHSGPYMIATHSGLQEAIDEWDERYGQRVQPDDPDLMDWGVTPEEGLDNALQAGEIRVNGGGILVWVDPYEWMQGFPSMRRLVLWFREQYPDYYVRFKEPEDH